MPDRILNGDGRPGAEPAAGAPPSVLTRTAAGMGWIVGWRMATRLLGLCNTLILVRLLAPADFGLVALGASFVLAVDTLSTLGVEDALVRERAPSKAMYDTAFTMNALRSLATAGVIAVAAIPVGDFFNEPRLSHIMWALSIGTLIEGAGSIGVVDFRRDMAFEKEFQLQVVPRILGIMATIAAALTWHSYWALVVGILVGRISRTAFGYRMHPYRPQPTLRAWRQLIGFSLWTWAVSMVQLVSSRVDAFAVGRILGPTEVGVYAIGEEVAALPTSELAAPLSRACFSGFTAARHAGDSVAETYMRAVSATFLITLPAGLGISLVADPLVRVAVGMNWLAAIPVIEVMGVAGAVSVFGVIAAVLLSVHGLLQRQFAVTASCLALRLLMLAPLVYHYGILGAALGAVAGGTVENAALVILAFRRFGLKYTHLWRQVWRTLLAGGIMVGTLVAAGLGWREAAGSIGALSGQLAVASLLGAATYAASLLGLWTLCGRPAGAEADLSEMIVRVLRTFLRRFGSTRVAWRS